MKKATRLVSWLLAASMALGLCPVSAFADDTGGEYSRQCECAGVGGRK